jgi:hypothetical protein
MFYEVLMEKKAGRYDSLSDASIRGPLGRYILGGAVAGGTAGRMSADEDNKTRDMLIGATAGGVLGAGASRLHKAFKAHKMKSKGARANYDFDGTYDLRKPKNNDPGKFTRVTYGPIQPGEKAKVYRGHGKVNDEVSRLADEASPLAREAYIKNKDIVSMNMLPDDLNDMTDMGLMRERELLRGGRNLLLGAGAGLGLAKLRKRDKEQRS